MNIHVRMVDGREIIGDKIDNNTLTEDNIYQIRELLQGAFKATYLVVWEDGRRVYINPRNIISISVHDAPNGLEEDATS